MTERNTYRTPAAHLQRLLCALDSVEWGHQRDEQCLWCGAIRVNYHLSSQAYVTGNHTTDCEWAALQELFKHVRR